MTPTAVIQTFSGRLINLYDPQPDDIDLIDIAHHLSHICRFGGATRVFYSVAEHSVHVAQLVPDSLRAAALLHDASEAYIGDLRTPLKQTLPSYQYVEQLITSAIMRRFDLDVRASDQQVIKHADLVMLATERMRLMPDDGQAWEILDGIEPLTKFWTPPYASCANAKERFLRDAVAFGIR